MLGADAIGRINNCTFDFILQITRGEKDVKKQTYTQEGISLAVNGNILNDNQIDTIKKLLKIPSKLSESALF